MVHSPSHWVWHNDLGLNQMSKWGGASERWRSRALPLLVIHFNVVPSPRSDGGAVLLQPYGKRWPFAGVTWYCNCSINLIMKQRAYNLWGICPTLTIDGYKGANSQPTRNYEVIVSLGTLCPRRKGYELGIWCKIQGGIWEGNRRNSLFCSNYISHQPLALE